MQNTRQQHYLQARYLDGFLAPPDDMLWCYGRRRPEPYRAIPDKVARQRDLYQIPNAPLGENLESFLEKVVETPGLKALRQLIASKKPPDLRSRIDLAKYIAFQEMRVPHTREVNREHTSQSISHMLDRFKETGGSSAIAQTVALVEGIEVKRDKPTSFAREDIEAYAKEIADNPESFDLETMVDLSNDMTTFYTAMRWTILLTRPSASFISSDCPVFRDFTEAGGDDALLRPDCRVYCPLSSRALLVMDHDIDFLELSVNEKAQGNGKTLPPTEFRTITNRGVLNFNQKIVEYSHRWCFSGIEQDWITSAMQRPSKRKKPEFFAQGELSGARWRRPD